MTQDEVNKIEKDILALNKVITDSNREVSRLRRLIKPIYNYSEYVGKYFKENTTFFNIIATHEKYPDTDSYGNFEYTYVTKSMIKYHDGASIDLENLIEITEEEFVTNLNQNLNKIAPCLKK
jgi:hypothetical protein